MTKIPNNMVYAFGENCVIICNNHRKYYTKQKMGEKKNEKMDFRITGFMHGFSIGRNCNGGAGVV